MMADSTATTRTQSDPASAIETLHANLKRYDIDIIERTELNPVSGFYVSQVRDRECAQIAADGTGLTEASSLAKALYAFGTGLSCNTFFSKYYWAKAISSGDFVHYPDEKWFLDEDDEDDFEMPEGLLDERLWEFYDPDDDLSLDDIFDRNSATDERGICALPFMRQSDSETVYFPVNFITNLYADNGTAAGETADEARIRALSEICARYIEKKVLDEKIALPLIPQEVIARYSHVEAPLQQLEAEGFSLRIADASLGGIFPVVNVSMVDPVDGTVLVVFGAHTSMEAALEQAMDEVLQRRRTDKRKSPAFNIDDSDDAAAFVSYEFFKQESEYPFVEWVLDADTENTFTALCKMIHQSGYEFYIADHHDLGLYSCRIIIPGISEIYPVEKLFWHNDNEGAHYRASLLSLDRQDENGWAEILEDLEDEGIDDTLKVADFIGILPDAGSRWTSLKVGTLKGMLALAIEEYEKALAWNSWSLHFGDLHQDETKHHRCIQALLEIVIDDSKSYAAYKEGLEFLYGAQTVQECVTLVQSKQQFHGLHFPGMELDGLKTHQALLDTYKKLHKAREKSLS